MNTRAEKQLSCKLCPFQMCCENLIDFQKFRYHYKTRHQIARIKIKDFRENILSRKEQSLKPKTYAKRCRVAKTKNCEISYPRQCSALRSNGIRCSIYLISAELRGRVRCQHHPYTITERGFSDDVVLGLLALSKTTEDPGLSNHENNKTTNLVNAKTNAKRKRTASAKGCSVIQPRQCTAVRSNGTRCCLRLISSEVRSRVRCQHHPLKTIEFAASKGMYGYPLAYVTVKPSTIKGGGNGVFTSYLGSFDVGDFITRFSGESLSEADITAGRNNREHTIECRAFNKRYISGIDKPMEGFGVGSLINKTDKHHPMNVEFVYRFPKTEQESVWVVATKRIEPNQELFTTYGNGFRVIVSA